MKSGMTIAILFAACIAAPAQTVPATNSGFGVTASGTLRYDLSYSETARFYSGQQGNAQSSALSGDMTYANARSARPFALTYSGGDMWEISGGAGGSGYFQHLLISQGIIGRKWSLNFADDISLLPQAPTTGFSGIPGVGSLPSTPAPPSQPVLTLNTRSVSNTTTSRFSRSLDQATSISAGGSYGIMRFPDGDGVETNQLQGNAGISRRLNARNSIFGGYNYSRFSYPDYTVVMESQSAIFGFTRAWNRRLSTSVSAGPQWVKGSASSGIPSSTGTFVSADATYRNKSTSASVNYSQGAAGGGGAITQFGTRNHDVSAVFSRQLDRSMVISASGAYMRTEGLQQSDITNSEYGEVSATRRLGRYINVFANYTATRQLSSTALPANAISGLSQVIGFGIGYSPREIHLRK